MALTKFESTAIAIMNQSGITEPTHEEIFVLAEDIKDMYMDEFQEEKGMSEIISILFERLGGTKNLRSYLNCLLIR